MSFSSDTTNHRALFYTTAFCGSNAGRGVNSLVRALTISIDLDRRDKDVDLSGTINDTGLQALLDDDSWLHLDDPDLDDLSESDFVSELFDPPTLPDSDFIPDDAMSVDSDFGFKTPRLIQYPALIDADFDTDNLLLARSQYHTLWARDFCRTLHSDGVSPNTLTLAMNRTSEELCMQRNLVFTIQSCFSGSVTRLNLCLQREHLYTLLPFICAFDRLEALELVCGLLLSNRVPGELDETPSSDMCRLPGSLRKLSIKVSEYKDSGARDDLLTWIESQGTLESLTHLAFYDDLDLQLDDSRPAAPRFLHLCGEDVRFLHLGLADDGSYHITESFDRGAYDIGHMKNLESLSLYVPPVGLFPDHRIMARVESVISSISSSAFHRLTLIVHRHNLLSINSILHKQDWDILDGLLASETFNQLEVDFRVIVSDTNSDFFGSPPLASGDELDRAKVDVERMFELCWKKGVVSQVEPLNDAGVGVQSLLGHFF
ncbi:hypothetical protein AAF712_002873 [Marasmius tenuissimus]|uniref:Uncharacterized protein n=1 Tax=Marasmius tenuissimus TaxID=585030 RepID=A0ABR3A9E3_9AGAR